MWGEKKGGGLQRLARGWGWGKASFVNGPGNPFMARAWIGAGPTTASFPVEFAEGRRGQTGPEGRRGGSGRERGKGVPQGTSGGRLERGWIKGKGNKKDEKEVRSWRRHPVKTSKTMHHTRKPTATSRLQRRKLKKKRGKRG